MTRLSFVLLAATLLSSTACNSDKVLAARRVLDKEPAKALALLQQADQERPSCFDCKVYLGLAYERAGNLEAAAAAYEQAMALPDAATRPEPVAARLLPVYEKLFANAQDADARKAIASKAAAIEASHKLVNAWGNQHLFDTLAKQLDAAIASGKAEDVKAAADAMLGLYVSAERKKTVAQKVTDGLSAAFVKKATEAFLEKVAGVNGGASAYDKATGEVVLVNRFRVPSPKDDVLYDPEGRDFKVNLRKGACVPLREKLGELVAKTAPAIGVRVPNNEDVDKLFVKLFEASAAGWVDGAESKARPAGETYLCTIRLPLPRYLAEFYRFTE
jgi:tetratricopeptide (TPR) repeat protein